MSRLCDAASRNPVPSMHLLIPVESANRRARRWAVDARSPWALGTWSRATLMGPRDMVPSYADVMPRARRRLLHQIRRAASFRGEVWERVGCRWGRSTAWSAFRRLVHPSSC